MPLRGSFLCEFFRHEEIFPNDPGAIPADYARAHRPDESPVGYSSAWLLSSIARLCFTNRF
jgi:hypothetical protein